MRKINRLILVLSSLLAAALRVLQNRTGFDELGLAKSGNLPGILLPVVLFAALLWFGSRSLGMLAERDPAVKPAIYFQFAENKASAALTVTGAFLILLSGALSVLRAGTMSAALLSAVFFIASAVCTLYAVFALYRRNEVSGIALLVPVCALFVHLILLYRADASDPVLARIYIEILAVAALTLSALERAAIVFRNGLPDAWLCVCSMSVILGVTAAADAATPAAAALFAGFALAEAGFLSATGFV